MAFDKVGAIYVWALIALIFAIWVPDRFPQYATVKQVLNCQRDDRASRRCRSRFR
jgi:ribose transport system permease protein